MIENETINPSNDLKSDQREIDLRYGRKARSMKR